MTKAQAKRKGTFGFLKVVELQNVGHSGGLLVVSDNGRPVEFHCTTPIAPNRAREIMYGRTYSEFLYGDQIGQALIDRCRSLPEILLTDEFEMLSLARSIATPMILVSSLSINSETEVDQPGKVKLDVEDYRLWFNEAGEETLAMIEQKIDRFSKTLPLDEPFERIRSAILEANQARNVA